ncbi:MAG TPA: hypothetical protein VMI72_15575 [Roseiarcus sp.]|nr:hypothetical protein [Roseiarcus sp.]
MRKRKSERLIAATLVNKLAENLLGDHDDRRVLPNGDLQRSLVLQAIGKTFLFGSLASATTKS